MTIGSTMSVNISPLNNVLVVSVSINAVIRVIIIKIPQRITAARAAKRLIFFINLILS